MSHDANVAYVRIGTSMVKAHAAFVADVIGLQQVDGSEEEAWFRSDIRRRTLVFSEGGPADSTLGVDLGDPETLDAAARRLSAAGHAFERLDRAECDRLFVRHGLRTKDPSGNTVELVVGPHHSGKRFFPRRDNGIKGLQGVGLRSLDTQRDTAFWCDLIGCSLRDHIGEIAFIGLDALHHRLVLYPSDRPGLLSVNFAVEDLELIMQNKYFFETGQVRIAFGPGRQAASGQIFVTVEGPDGLLYSLVSETAVIDPARHRPRQFAAAANSLCTWGSQPKGVPEYELPDAEKPAQLHLVTERKGAAR